MAATDSPTPAMSPGTLAEREAQAGPVVPLHRLRMGGKERGITAAQRNITERRLSLQDTNDATRPILAAIGKAPTSAMSRVLSTPLPSSASFRNHPPATSHLATGPPIASERPARGASTNSTQPLRCTSRRSSLESEPLSDEQGQQRSGPRPHRPSLAIGGHKIGAKKTGKRTSMTQGGKVALSGAPSPPPKTIVTSSDDLSTFFTVACNIFLSLCACCTFLRRNQQTIHRQLAVTTAIACALSSALSLSRNRANIYFVEYFGENPLGVLCMVIAYSLPFTKWLHGVFIDFDGTVRRLLWGAIITVAGSGLIKAVTTPCNPLYFAIPVTVAASTSLILPTSGLAVLTNLIDTGPVQMLLLGLVLKFIALVMILLTVKLNTAFLRLPRWFFTERRDQSVTTALYDSPDERVRRLYCTISVSRC
ncbi:hypothetical protein HPB50_026215 [Hyalomma asiaticum]|uniref:Uncharacterized protein n=1 Tax=Hyalomma asiaticum TaxID=266040 RepID=A0ACB7S5H9_HYAAI|nr:hypothetical protein HPB50_026215 [Hyalomma asiaticum]